MLVTLHLAEGQTIKDLIGEIAALTGVRPRTVSGRVGVLVDAELAYQYLADRYAPPEPVAEPEPTPAENLPPVKKTAAKKAAKATVAKGE